VATVKKQVKWLIVGGNGQLGRAMKAELAESGANFVSLDRVQLDITNSSEITRVFGTEKPDVVLNAAAWTGVDEAEDAEEAAQLVNAYGAGLLARECAVIGARIIHISTDYVFSGVSEIPWAEESVLAPTSAYGRTKAQGERLVQMSSPNNFFIVRTAWLYSPWGKNFVKTMVRLAMQETRSVEVVCDQMGQPTSALDLAAQIRKMIEHNVSSGIYHGTNSGQASWFEFAQYIFELSGGDPGRVVPIESSHFDQRARRPSCSTLGHQRWFDEGLTPMRSWRKALEDVLPTVISAVDLGE
jgi:dTDP-4-dehydrorhamnose reductase